jgi:hypothetical protein
MCQWHAPGASGKLGARIGHREHGRTRVSFSVNGRLVGKSEPCDETWPNDPPLGPARAVAARVPAALAGLLPRRARTIQGARRNLCDGMPPKIPSKHAPPTPAPSLITFLELSDDCCHRHPHRIPLELISTYLHHPLAGDLMRLLYKMSKDAMRPGDSPGRSASSSCSRSWSGLLQNARMRAACSPLLHARQ